MKNEPLAFGRYVKLFNSGEFVAVVELVDTDTTTVDVRTAEGKVMTVGRSDIAALTGEEEKEFLRTFKPDSSQADPGSQAA